MQELISLSQHCCQSAFGGVVELEYLPTSYIQSEPDDYELLNANSINTPIVPINGQDWLSLMVYPESVGFKEKMTLNKQGNLINTSIKGEFPSKSNTVRRLFDRMKNHRFVLKMKMQDGSTLVIGTKASPFTFIPGNVIGNKIPDGYKYAFEFKGKTRHFAYTYNF